MKEKESDASGLYIIKALTKTVAKMKGFQRVGRGVSPAASIFREYHFRAARMKARASNA